MYFEIQRKELLTPLKMIIGVVEQRQTLPIMANCLCRVKDNALHLTATDAEVEIACKLPLEIGEIDNEGETTLPARKFFDICKSLPDSATIKVSIDDTLATITAGKSKFKLQTLPADEFPETPELVEPTEFQISTQQFKKLLSKTSFCIAVNDVRYYLTGLLLQIADGKISLVGTDGHRMAVAQHDFESEKEAQVIIPRKAVLELLKLLTDTDAEIVVTSDQNHIKIQFNDALVMTSKLIDGQFPDWQNVLPASPDKIVLVDTKKFKQSVARAVILSNEKYKGVRLSLTAGFLHLNGKNAYQEEAEEVVEIEYNGEELEIGFNGTYLLDAINVVSTSMVQLAFGDSNSSCLITEEDNDDCKLVVMPMRL